MRIGPKRVYRAGRQAVSAFQRDDVLGSAAEVAFRLIFSLPPLVIFFAAVSAVVAQYTGVDVFSWISAQLRSSVLPYSVIEAIEVVLKAVKNEGNPGLVSVGIVIALWSSSGAVGALIKALNRAYDVKETRSFARRRLLALTLTLGLSVLVIASFVIFVFGGRLGEWVASDLGYGSAFTSIWGYARWPASVLLACLALSILYWFGPAVDQSLRWIVPGALLTTLLWLAATWGFSAYLRISDPGSAYGALGTVVVLLFFLYVSTIVLLLGAELNALLDKRFDPKLIKEKAAHPELQTEDVATVRRRAAALEQRQQRARATRLGRPALPSALASIFLASVGGMFRRDKQRGRS